jgi:hypothetical protein
MVTESSRRTDSAAPLPLCRALEIERTRTPVGAERFALGYFGVDPLNPVEAGHAHAVVAVIHEVIPAQLQQAHRRQLLPEAKSSVDPLPFLRGSLGQGHEILVELLVLAYATDDPRYLDRPPAPIHSSADRNGPPDLVGGEEGASGTPPEQACLQSLVAPGVETKQFESPIYNYMSEKG